MHNTEVVRDEVDLEAVKAEARAHQAAHPRSKLDPSPLPAFLARKAHLRALATAMLKRHDEAAAMFRK